MKSLVSVQINDMIYLQFVNDAMLRGDDVKMQGMIV